MGSINSTMFYIPCLLYLMTCLRDLCILGDIELLHAFYQMQSILSHGCPVVCFMSLSSDWQNFLYYKWCWNAGSSLFWLSWRYREGKCWTRNYRHFNRHCQITLQKDYTNFLSHQQSFHFRNEENEAQKLYDLPNIIKI